MERVGQGRIRVHQLVVQDLRAGIIGDVGEVPHALPVEHERDVHERDCAIREKVWDDVVHVHCRPGEGDSYLDGDIDEVRRMVPGSIEDLAGVELGGLDGADVALLAGGADVPGIIGGEVSRDHGSIAVSECVVDCNIDGNRSGR